MWNFDLSFLMPAKIFAELCVIVFILGYIWELGQDCYDKTKRYFKKEDDRLKMFCVCTKDYEEIEEQLEHITNRST